MEEDIQSQLWVFMIYMHIHLPTHMGTHTHDVFHTHIHAYTHKNCTICAQIFLFTILIIIWSKNYLDHIFIVLPIISNLTGI